MKKKLMRSRRDNKVAGVCGGIAEYFNIDVVIVRIIWVISAILGGPGLGVYILCAIIIPKEPIRTSYDKDFDSNKEEKQDGNFTEQKYNEATDDYDNYGREEAYDRYNEEEIYEDRERAPYDEDRESSPYDEDDHEEKEINFAYLGIGLMGLGAFLAFKAIFPGFSFTFFMPAILIIGGLLLLNRNNDNKEID